jgi:hypothetical protein
MYNEKNVTILPPRPKIPSTVALVRRTNMLNCVDHTHIHADFSPWILCFILPYYFDFDGLIRDHCSLAEFFNSE